MIKYLLFCFMCVFLFNVKPAKAYWEPHWEARSSIVSLQTANLGQNKVVIIGDSNSEAFPYSTLNGCTVINAGFGGIKIHELATYAQQVAITTHPKIAHVMVGTNNLGMSHDDPSWLSMATDLHTTVQAFLNVGAKVVFWPVFPTSAALAESKPKSDRDAINLIVYNEYMAVRGNSPYVAFWDWYFPQQYEDINGYAITGALVEDGIHFSATTQTARADRIKMWHDYIKSTTGTTCN